MTSAALIPFVCSDINLPTTLIADDAQAAKRYVEASTAPASRRAYESDWSIYLEWCAERTLTPLPSAPPQVALFLAREAERGLAVSTIERRLAAIGYFHRATGHPAPTAMTDAIAIEVVLKGIRRTVGAAPKHKKKAATHDLVRMMLDAIPEQGVGNLRDRALLAFGLASAMRRSEIIAVEVGHITRTDDGIQVLIPKSKTDQDGQGVIIAIPRGLRIRPLAALEAWLAAAKITEGPVFRRLLRGGKVSSKALSGESVSLILKARAEAVGLNAAELGAHSLRSGFLTSAAKSGANIFKMRAQSRHESLDVLAGYVRDADLFRDHAGSGFL